MAQAAAIATASVGVVALVGWTFDIDALKGAGGAITMKANMAIALVACGAAFGAILEPSPRAKQVGAALAIVAGLLGTLTLSEHLVGWNLGIDELVFVERAGAVATASPNRFGPSGAISLMLASLSMLWLARGTPAAVARAQLAACALAALAIVAITGYWYGAHQLYAVARITGIALPTALTFLALSAGLLAARIDAGPVATVVAAGPGGRMARRLLIVAVGLPLAVGYLRVVGQRTGLYDTELGTALFAIALVATLVFMIWRTAAELNDADARRQAAEDTRRAAEQELLHAERRVREQAQAANQVKDEFLATLSHELRTPLNAIIGWGDLLRSGTLAPGRGARAVEVICNNARRQLALVEELLDMSRIVSGKMHLNLEPLLVSEIVQAAIDVVRPAADGRDLRVDADVQPLDLTIRADRDRLQQVVWNLLANAVKFTPPGGRIDVRVDRMNGDMRLRVSDTGIGIAPQFLPFLFERFRQADSSPARSYGGLGLGLAIARNLVELHGGRIEAASDGQDAGATFSVFLPLNQPADTFLGAGRRRDSSSAC